MSAGERLPLSVAEGAAGYLLNAWGVAEKDATVVGSVRRGRQDVGDLEICMPLERPDRDEMYKTIHASATQEGGLFEAPADVPPITVVQGLRPGFKQARLIVHISYEGRPIALPVEIYRFEAGARAWSIIMRTGPRDFGMFFLRRWKAAYSIPASQVASSEGMLVDRYGKPVPISGEREAFDRAGIGWVDPLERDRFAATIAEGRAAV